MGHDTESLEEDISALFESILFRINEQRDIGNKVVILDREKAKAIREYAQDHPYDRITFGDD